MLLHLSGKAERSARVGHLRNLRLTRADEARVSAQLKRLFRIDCLFKQIFGKTAAGTENFRIHNRLGPGIFSLVMQDTRNRRVDHLHRHAPLLHSLLQRIHRTAHLIVLMRNENQLNARQNRADNAFFNAIGRADGVHLHAVRNNQAVKAHLCAQQIGHDFPRHRCGHIVQLTVYHVRNRHRGNMRPNRLLKGHKLRLPQLVQTLCADRKLQMGIRRHIAMPGKMLARTHHARIQISAHRLRRIEPGILRIPAVAADADYRIRRIAVDIQNRRKVKIHAQRTKLLSAHPRRLIDFIRLMQSGQRHRRGHFAHRLRQTGNDAALLIDRNQRILACFAADERAYIARQTDNLLRALQIILEQNDIADLFVLHQRTEGFVHLFRRKAGHKHLPQLFAQRHFAYALRFFFSKLHTASPFLRFSRFRNSSTVFMICSPAFCREGTFIP